MTWLLLCSAAEAAYCTLHRWRRRRRLLQSPQLRIRRIMLCCCYYYCCSTSKKVFILTTRAIQTSVIKYDSGVHDYMPILTAATTIEAASKTQSKSRIDKPIKSILDKRKKKKKKRGTRTTGVGASTSALLSAYNNFDSDAEEENQCDEIVNNNPMLGKLWVRIPARTASSSSSSSSSSLIFKLYPSSNDSRVGEAVHIELSELSPKDQQRRKLNVRFITNDGSEMESNSKPHHQSSSSSIPSSTSSEFMPIEGIYGVYQLPHAGPHIVLITDSERVYKSPSITLMPSSSDDMPLLELRKITCLEIVSLRDGSTNKEEVMHDNNDGDEKNSSTAPSKTSIMKEEETRQLRLLRKSFAEHDLYFTVPSHYYRHHHKMQRRRRRIVTKYRHSTNNCEPGDGCNDVNDDDTLDGDVIIVPDVTHTLQRSFIGINGRHHSSATTTRWWTQYVTATDNVTHTATATAKKRKKEEEHGVVQDENSDDSIWDVQYPNWRAGPRISPQTGIDPRFFWNELPALSLLPPSSSCHLYSAGDDSIDSRRKGSSSISTTTILSPYCHLLDHLIPVASAFVGVRKNVPIPIASSVAASPSSKSFSTNNNDTVEAQQLHQQQQIQDVYDQLLISRRSKFRAGTRFTRRGTDETGNVANYAETEQICFIVSRTDDNLPIVNEDVARVNDTSNGDRNNEVTPTTKEQNAPPAITTTLREIYSHVQTRGSIPLHWSSPVMTVGTYRPRVYICVDPLMQARGLRDHLLGDLQRYSLSSSSYLASSPSSSAGFGGGDAFGTRTKITIVNLIDKHGDQGRLGRAFDSVLSAVLDVYKNNDEADDGGSYQSSVNDVDNDDEEDDDGCGSDDVAEDDELKTNYPEHFTLPLRVGLTPNSIKHIWYDFHAECKGGRYDRLSQLLEQVIPTLNDQGYFCAALSSASPTANTTTITPTWEIRSLQDGVVRTNCMDCLDRTNVVQSMFGRYMLYRQLHQRIGLTASSNRRSLRRTLPLECVVGYKQRPLTLPWTEGEAAHRYLWADNADAISRLYAGTPALKGDFTRTGKRTRRGAFDDGLNSLQRYYLNNFIDADRQEGMDLLVGSVEFDVAMPISSTVSGDDEENDSVGRMTDESSRLLMLQELEKRSSKRRGYDGSHARIKVKSGESFGGNGDGGGKSSTNGETTTQNQSLKWMPKDLHYHMKHEAHLSRSPLSAAAREENLDAPTSADFLLQVTSSAAGDEVPLSDGGGDAMKVGCSLSVTGDRPWWALTSFKRDTVTKCDLALANVGNGKIRQVLGKKILGIAPQPVVIVLSLLLLCRSVPVLFAALILAIVSTSGLCQSPLVAQHEDHAGD